MRIAIANDCVMAVEAMSRVIARASDHQLAWTARNGLEAVERCGRDTPDLILMDLIMPELDGVQATRRIMEATPCPILIVTATVDALAGKVFECLGAGAIDAVSTPVLGADGAGGGAATLLSKIETIRRLSGRGEASRRRPTPSPPATHDPRPLVVFGASAGGPAALGTILHSLPPDFPAAIVIVQHVDEEFAPFMAVWLNEQSALPVRLAREGDRPQSGLALMAATNDHLVLRADQSLAYTREPLVCSYRPSADQFFDSVLRHWRGGITGVLLTGMGRDGARGLKALRDAGALTIAQDRASCVVYGMPKAAAEMGAAAEVLPLGKIAARLGAHCAILNAHV
jgi:two-component system response regulator WspF